jgi:hypothetical protein
MTQMAADEEKWKAKDHFKSRSPSKVYPCDFLPLSAAICVICG